MSVIQAVAVNFRTRKPALIELQEPSLTSRSQVKVKVQRVGISSLDRAIARGAAGKPPSGGHLLILGRQMTGRVVQVGRGVQKLRPGDPVTTPARRGCQVCGSCLAGQEDLCYSGLYTERGAWEAPGFLCEYLVDEESTFIPIPQKLEDTGVLLEPLSVCLKATTLVQEIQRRVPPRCHHPEHGWDKPGWGNCKRTLVVGTGTTGMLAALLLRAHGANVSVCGPQPQDSPQGRLLQKAGAQFLSFTEVPLSDLREAITEVDLVMEASGDPEAPVRLAPVLARNSTLVLLGTPVGHNQMGLDTAQLLRDLVQGNQTILGCSTSGRKHYLSGVETLTHLPAPYSTIVSQLLTNRYPLAQFKNALAPPPPTTIKAIFEL